MEWTKKRPTKPGKYWFYSKNGFKRIVSIWDYKIGDGQLFTSDDGGSPLADEYYDGGYWWGPINEPPDPKGIWCGLTIKQKDMWK